MLTGLFDILSVAIGLIGAVIWITAFFYSRITGGKIGEAGEVTLVLDIGLQLVKIGFLIYAFNTLVLMAIGK